jgi:uncharacterized protein with HEPN domain
MKDDTVYLRHILDSIKSIVKYLEGISFETYMKDELIQDGVIRRLEIIGEASRNTSQDFREQYSEIPWSQIISLRNRIVHAYFNINLNTIWTIVQDELPILKQNVENILGENRDA